MIIHYKGKDYEWIDGEELQGQSKEMQEVFNNELKYEFMQGKCIDEQFEPTGNSQRMTLQKNLWDGLILETQFVYKYPADHEMNGIVESYKYYIYEQVD